MNEIQKKRVDEIGTQWNETGCPYDVREEINMVFMVVLSMPNLEEKGTALAINESGKTNWVVKYPRKSPVPVLKDKPDGGACGNDDGTERV